MINWGSTPDVLKAKSKWQFISTWKRRAANDQLNWTESI